MTASQPGTAPLIGYVDPLRGRPGETLSFMISSAGGRDFTARVVRLDCCDPNPAGPGMKAVPVEVALEPSYRGIEQPVYAGSCGYGPAPELGEAGCLIVEATIKPTLSSPQIQVVWSLQSADANHGLALAVVDNRIVLMMDHPERYNERIETGIAVVPRRWSRVRLAFERGGRATQLEAVALDNRRVRRVQRGAFQFEHAVLAAGDDGSAELFCVAARWRDHPQLCFNGLIEAPGIFAADAGYELVHTDAAADTVNPALHAQPDVRTLARWDFAQGVDQQWAPDTVGGAAPERRLTLVNLPVRAVRGVSWSGEHMDWNTAPNEYAAIHFHADDLLDCGWQPGVTLPIPAGMPSGVYGLEIDNGVATDTIPFYVTPARDGPRARLAFLAPTLTYLAYANHARGNFAGALAERVAAWQAYPHNPDDITAYGASTYNRHRDGSGISLSSRRRPNLGMRPGYLTFCDSRGSGLRHFPADSHLTDWLRTKGFDFDVVTDEDLDDDGVAALAGYDVVLTGSHPEYHTRRMLDALLEYRTQGGNLMYLGGNGFYWKIARVASLPHVLEIRRAEGGIRAWASEPGEYYHQLDCSYGGMWRRNGTAPQVVGGVGFAVQGDFEGSYYKRTPASKDGELAWLFDGVDGVGGERLGNYGLSGGGAAGFELDQASLELGTPDDLEIVAVSEEHGPSFRTVPEEILTWTLSASIARPYEGLCAHMVYGEPPSGGGLFAVGSITFIGSLSHNQYGPYDNDMSRIVLNCLRRFGVAPSPRPLLPTGESR